jgi:hypothetical protein
MAATHQLAASVKGALYTRCGIRWLIGDWKPGRGIHSAPEPVTAWASQVTCPACLTPPGWAAAGLP